MQRIHQGANAGMHRIKGLCAAFALGLAALTAHAAPAVDDMPPDGLGTTMKGDEVRISDRRGKVVVVAFWASWCGYCRKQLPVLQAIQAAAGHDRLEVVLVNFQEPRSTYREIARKLKGAMLTVTYDRDGSISDAYGVDSVPKLFVIAKDGRVGWTHSGYSEESIPRIGAALDRLLAEPWPPAQDSPLAATRTEGG